MRYKEGKGGKKANKGNVEENCRKTRLGGSTRMEGANTSKVEGM